jgi:hypothetical protein
MAQDSTSSFFSICGHICPHHLGRRGPDMKPTGCFIFSKGDKNIYKHTKNLTLHPYCKPPCKGFTASPRPAPISLLHIYLPYISGLVYQKHLKQNTQSTTTILKVIRAAVDTEPTLASAVLHQPPAKPAPVSLYSDGHHSEEHPLDWAGSYTGNYI